MQTYKLLGLLLTYPEEQLQAALPAFDGIIVEEGLVSKKQIKLLRNFINSHAERDLIDWQEEYVGIFDRSRNHSLYLFEHIHGESRDRGMAMVDMRDMYVAKGLSISSNELPDYLPLFLEYLSFCEIKEATGLLGEVIDVIATIGSHLAKNNSSYAAVFGALQSLSAIKPNKVKVANAVKNAPRDPESLDEIDQQWQEAEAFGNDDCGGCEVPNTSGSQQILSGEIQ